MHRVGKDARSWNGEVVLSITRALYAGPAFDTEIHAHHAIQVAVALDAPFGLRESNEEKWRSYEAALIASGVRHQLDGRGGRHVLLYLEPESIDGRRISRPTSGTGIGELPRSILENVRGAFVRAEREESSAARTHRLFTDVFGSLDLAPLNRFVLDRRIGAVIQELRNDPNRYGSLPALATSAALSPSRFRHLFTAEMGVSCRRYLLWVRLYNAVRELSKGGSLTEAAHAVGFADAAHLTRTFRGMFGIVPSAISRSVHLVSEDVY